ncbi:hypothetical protein EU537_12995 [Candidatus Thorarchaeota archaeon]|nr:MAG: hypothetical protein EU537_12995 [Candidatus Thorarchaeota archaeon]
MNSGSNDIVRCDFQHGKIAYAFHWNRSHHQDFGKDSGDSAALWAHLTQIINGKTPESFFRDPFYQRASSLRLRRRPPHVKVRLRKRLEKADALHISFDDELVDRIRELHRNRGDPSYQSDHTIVKDFLTADRKSVAIEVPVWSERLHLTGHIDLVRIVDDAVQVCDYKPGSLDSTTKRFMESLPQVAAYGEMMTHRLASTLRSALDTHLLPKVKCCIFDTHSSWHFGAELLTTLQESGAMNRL